MNDAIQFTSELVNFSHSKNVTATVCVVGFAMVVAGMLWRFVGSHRDDIVSTVRTVFTMLGVIVTIISFCFSLHLASPEFGATEEISQVSSSGDDYSSLKNSSVQEALKSKGYAVVTSSDKPNSTVRIADGDNTSFDVVKLDENGNVPSTYDNPPSCIVSPVSVRDDFSSVYKTVKSKAVLTYTMKCKSAEDIKAKTAVKSSHDVFELGQEK